MPQSDPQARAPCACIRARRAARALTDVYDDALRPAGLKITQFSALRNAARLQPVSISALADEMALDRSTLGRNLLVLERRGLVRLGPGDDQRERSVSITPAAQRLLARAVPLWEQAQRAVERVLGRDEVTTLLELLARVEGLRRG
jgi:DNA-binding MarR family transcriptional regulator